MSCGRQKKVKYHLPEETIDEMLREAEDDDLVFPPERWAATFRSHAQFILSDFGEYLGYSPRPLLERLIEDAVSDGGIEIDLTEHVDSDRSGEAIVHRLVRLVQPLKCGFFSRTEWRLLIPHSRLNGGHYRDCLGIVYYMNQETLDE